MRFGIAHRGELLYFCLRAGCLLRASKCSCNNFGSSGAACYSICSSKECCTTSRTLSSIPGLGTCVVDLRTSGDCEGVSVAYANYYHGYSYFVAAHGGCQLTSTSLVPAAVGRSSKVVYRLHSVNFLCTALEALNAQQAS